MKYNAKKVTVDWHTFDSTVEADYYRDNKALIKAIQPKYTLQPEFSKNGKKFRPIAYVADFELYDGTVVDIKWMATPEAMIKRKLFEYTHPDKELLWLSFSKKWGGWVEYDQLIKLRKNAKLLRNTD